MSVFLSLSPSLSLWVSTPDYYPTRKKKHLITRHAYNKYLCCVGLLRSLSLPPSLSGGIHTRLLSRQRRHAVNRHAYNKIHVSVSLSFSLSLTVGIHIPLSFRQRRHVITRHTYTNMCGGLSLSISPPLSLCRYPHPTITQIEKTRYH